MRGHVREVEPGVWRVWIENGAGISAGYLSDLLKGTKSNPSRPTVRNIAEALEIDPRALFIEPAVAENAA